VPEQRLRFRGSTSAAWRAVVRANRIAVRRVVADVAPLRAVLRRHGAGQREFLPRAASGYKGRVRTTLPTLGLALGCLLLALPACGETSKEKRALSGEAVYAAQGCALCHGSDATGTSHGPTLFGKASFWDREKLVAYLKAPIAYAEQDPRLAEQKKRYSLPMRAFDKVPEEELGAVAEYVLGLP
jgi:mono/diheme cytochrome c family protein